MPKGNLRIALGALLAAGIIAAALWLWPPGRQGSSAKVVVPELSAVATAGAQAFQTHCSRCHGPNGQGTDQGPPLIHRYYEPGHHGDASFVLAARRGVRQHHWQFGDMPPVPEVGDRSLQQIIEFVREVQVANGIE